VLDKTGVNLPIDVAPLSIEHFDANRMDWREKFRQWLDAARLSRTSLPLTAVSPVAIARPVRPYPRLRLFEPEEWAIFFGRARMVDVDEAPPL
jgi:hypothetical protein